MNSGASAWIGALRSVSTGPRSSIGSPMTLRIRPSVRGPTGTRICEPVSVTSWPRVRPSVASIAMVRTVFSPRCWATSRTSRFSPFFVSSADRIAGRLSSNVTSTTAPMTWLMRPTLLVVARDLGFSILTSLLSGSLERFSARDDFNEFGGNRGLTRAVVLDGQAVDHVAGIAGRIVHRGHTAALLGCRIFKHRPEQLDGDIARQQIGENLFLVGLIFRCSLSSLSSDISIGCERNGDDLDFRRLLHQRGAEAGEEEVRDVEFAGVKAPDQILRNLMGVGEAHILDVALIDLMHDPARIEARDHRAALLADQIEADLLALLDQLLSGLTGKLDDVAVERTGEAALGCRDHQQMDIVLAGAREQLGRLRANRDLGGQARHHRRQPLGIRTASLGRLL